MCIECACGGARTHARVCKSMQACQAGVPACLRACVFACVRPPVCLNFACAFARVRPLKRKRSTPSSVATRTSIPDNKRLSEPSTNTAQHNTKRRSRRRQKGSLPGLLSAHPHNGHFDQAVRDKRIHLFESLGEVFTRVRLKGASLCEKSPST